LSSLLGKVARTELPLFAARPSRIPLLRFVEVEDVVVELGTVQILDAKLPRACLPDSSIA
jgi:hypothetical protein